MSIHWRSHSKPPAVTRTRERAMPRADCRVYTNSALTEPGVPTPPPSNRASLEGRRAPPRGVRRRKVCHMLFRPAEEEARMRTRKKAKKSRPGVSGFARTAMTAMVSASVIFGGPQAQGRTHKPPLYGQHWMAVTGKPIGAAVAAKIFERGGNAVDAACAMIAATATPWTTLSWGRGTPAPIFNPPTAKGIGLHRLR